MSQNTVTFSDDPSGDELLDNKLTPLQENIETTNGGTSRPAYAQRGTLWVDWTTNPVVLNYFDGTDDIALATIDETGNVVVINGSVLQDGSITLAKLANAGAQYRLMFRTSAGDGAWQSFQSTAFIATLLDDADAASARGTLGLSNVVYVNGAQNISDKTHSLSTYTTGNFNAAGASSGAQLRQSDSALVVSRNSSSSSTIQAFYNPNGHCPQKLARAYFQNL